MAALPVVAQICKVRRSRQVCHWDRLPMRSGGPHAEPPPPASIFRFFMRLSFPMRFRGLPTHGPPPHTVSRFPHTATRLTHFPIRFPRIHHTIRKLQRIRPQIRRDQRPAPQIRHPPVSTNSLRSVWRSTTYVVISVPTPAETSADGLHRSTRQSGSLRFHRPTTGGHGRRQRCGVAATSTTGGPARLYDRAIGPKGPITVKP